MASFPRTLHNLLASSNPDVTWVRQPSDNTSRLLIRNWEQTVKQRDPRVRPRQFRNSAPQYGLRTLRGDDRRNMYVWDPTQRFVEDTWRSAVLELKQAPKPPRRNVDLTYGTLTPKTTFWERLEQLFASRGAQWTTDAGGRSVVSIRDWRATLDALLGPIRRGAFQRMARTHGLDVSVVNLDELVLCDPSQRFTASRWIAWALARPPPPPPVTTSCPIPQLAADMPEELWVDAMLATLDAMLTDE
jgi:hypothetical protein